jgi:hypothetical protein
MDDAKFNQNVINTRGQQRYRNLKQVSVDFNKLDNWGHLSADDINQMRHNKEQYW